MLRAGLAVLLLCCALPAAAFAQKAPQPPAPDSAAPAREPSVEPAGDGLLDRLSRIRLPIRPRSSASVAVPELRGAPAASAREALARAGLELGAVDELPVDGPAPGTVVLQHPAAGTRVPRGSTVGVMLAAAPAVAVGPPVADPSPARPSAPVESPPADPPPVAQAPTVDPPPVQQPALSGAVPVVPSATDAIVEPLAEPARPAESVPPATSVRSSPQAAGEPRPSSPDVAVPADTTDARTQWPWWVLGIAVVALAATAAFRRLRAPAAPVAIHARTRPGAAPCVELRGEPFGGGRVSLRARVEAAVTVSAGASPFPADGAHHV